MDRIDMVDVAKNSMQKIIDKMEMHERITLKNLIDKIVFETQIPVSIANGLIPMLLHSHTEVKIEKGQGGGVFKGGRRPICDNRPRCSECNQVVKPAKV